MTGVERCRVAADHRGRIMTAAPISLVAVLRLPRALRCSTARSLAARSRPTTPDRHLADMEGAWTAWVQTAVDAGMTPGEIGGAAGISDPPARLGMDDADVPVELAMSRRWTA